MTTPSISLTVQFLEWLAAHPRTYAEVMEVWRTSCPRLSIWEDACIAGLVDTASNDATRFVPSAKGREFLAAQLPLQVSGEGLPAGKQAAAMKT